MDCETLDIEIREPWARITLARPDVRNALNGDMVDELLTVLERVEEDESIAAVIITGAGSAFCAGADLKDLQRMHDRSTAENRADSHALKDLLLALHTCDVPIIAAVNGPALAGGCGLATACDIVIAAESATFGYPEVKIGFVAAIVSAFLVTQVGQRTARNLLLTGRTLEADEAVDLGLVNEVVPDDDLDEAAEEMAERIARNSPEAIALTKSILGRLPGMGLSEALDMAADLNALARTTDDCREGVAAFLDKRKPEWR